MRRTIATSRRLWSRGTWCARWTPAQQWKRLPWPVPSWSGKRSYWSYAWGDAVRVPRWADRRKLLCRDPYWLLEFPPLLAAPPTDLIIPTQSETSHNSEACCRFSDQFWRRKKTLVKTVWSWAAGLEMAMGTQQTQLLLNMKKWRRRRRILEQKQKRRRKRRRYVTWYEWDQAMEEILWSRVR